MTRREIRELKDEKRRLQREFDETTLKKDALARELTKRNDELQEAIQTAAGEYRMSPDVIGCVTQRWTNRVRCSRAARRPRRAGAHGTPQVARGREQ